MFAEHFAGAIECAEFHELNDLAHKLWKAHAAGHLDDGEAQALAERLQARKPKTVAIRPGFQSVTVKVKRTPQRSPDKQASIERRRRLARASPVPPALVHEFTQGQHAVITVVAGEIQRAGACTRCIAFIAALAGVCDQVVRDAMHKAREVGLMFSTERRRRGQKSLTNIVRVLRRSWGAWLKRIGSRKFGSTTDQVSRSGKSDAVDRSGSGLLEAVRLVRGERCRA